MCINAECVCGPEPFRAPSIPVTKASHQVWRHGRGTFELLSAADFTTNSRPLEAWRDKGKVVPGETSFVEVLIVLPDGTKVLFFLTE